MDTERIRSRLNFLLSDRYKSNIVDNIQSISDMLVMICDEFDWLTERELVKGYVKDIVCDLSELPKTQSELEELLNEEYEEGLREGEMRSSEEDYERGFEDGVESVNKNTETPQ
jgi:hypothetical protein